MNKVSHQSNPQLAPDEVARNLKGIMDVPPDVLPHGNARVTLMALASSAYDVYAYQSGGASGTWCVWLGPLADVAADHNGRVTVADWIQQYDTLYTVVNVLAAINTPPQTGGAA